MHFSPLLLPGAVALALLSVPCAAQRAGTSGLRLPPPAPPAIGGFNGGFPVFVVEREVPVVVEREVVREVPPTPSPSLDREGSASPRKPYVIGASYASLPGSCMKLIEEGASFYYCSGEWYRQVGDGRSVSYKAVARKL